MNGAQKAIFPGILAGVFLLVILTNLIAAPNAVLASTEVAPGADMAAPVEPAVDEYGNALPVIYTAEEVPAEQPVERDEDRDDSDCSVSASFPDSVRQWCGLISQYANEHGLDPDLVAAVIVQESGGNPDAYSHSGAVGLMQVMPRDGLAAGFMCINGPCFGSRPSMSELYDAEFNVSYGTRMLSGLVAKRGSVRDGLMAYGPANVGYYYADKVLAIYENNRN
jgi:soluble lytic murein transglycosylase-like protein